MKNHTNDTEAGSQWLHYLSNERVLYNHSQHPDPLIPNKPSLCPELPGWSSRHSHFYYQPYAILHFRPSDTARPRNSYGQGSIRLRFPVLTYPGEHWSLPSHQRFHLHFYSGSQDLHREGRFHLNLCSKGMMIPNQLPEAHDFFLSDS